VTKWRYVDRWSEDDPAVTLMRDALALRPVEEPSRPEASADTRLDATTRRERIAQVVRRIEAGDLSAVDTLRELLSNRP
jgi:hypothetical protein